MYIEYTLIYVTVNQGLQNIPSVREDGYNVEDTSQNRERRVRMLNRWCEIYFSTQIADITENVIHSSSQITCIAIIDEILQSQIQQRIASLYFAPQAIDLPTISYCYRKRGYLIALSPTDELQQISQLCILALVALTGIDSIREYKSFKSFDELIECYPAFEKHFTAMRNAILKKNTPVL